jgi:hypothetical protein
MLLAVQGSRSQLTPVLLFIMQCWAPQYAQRVPCYNTFCLTVCPATSFATPLMLWVCMCIAHVHTWQGLSRVSGSLLGGIGLSS